MSKASDYVISLFEDLEKQRKKWLNTNMDNPDYLHEFIQYATF